MSRLINTSRLKNRVLLYKEQTASRRSVENREGFGDVIVFFNDGSSKPSGPKVIGDAQDGLFEIGVLSQPHSAVFLGLPGARVGKRREHSKIEFGKWIQRGPQLPQGFWFLADLFAEGAKHGANSWRFMPRDF